ncbi:MAG: FAD-dependent oxidoreductase [Lachnospiraceae bacterium]|nr:FAD-dependent oxidoreductase [Lachnospiraceae bacterium]
MIRIDQIKLPCGSDKDMLEGKIRKLLRLSPSDVYTWKIVRHSLDARKKPALFDIYSVQVSLGEDKKSEKREEKKAAAAKSGNIRFERPVSYSFPEPDEQLPVLLHRPVVVGFGPAGLFCALMLARAGYRPIVLERGASMEERTADVENFWKTGVLNGKSNIQFGEGGAGTYSDGKLTTNVKDKFGRIGAVMETFVKAGAPEDITYEYHPHIGTDLLRGVIVRLREEIRELGGEVRFHSRMTALQTESGHVTGVEVEESVFDASRAGQSDYRTGQEQSTCGVKEEETRTYVLPAEVVVLAPGHSARDTIRTLHQDGIPMTQKNFAVGCRVSHPQAMIDRWAVGIEDQEELQRLGIPASSYKLTAQAKSGRGVYSFCMCPGGYVVNASSEQGRLAVNGMSDYARDSARANSAIVMTVGAEEFGGEDVLAGLHFQERLEEKAFRIADGRVPVEKYQDLEQEFSAAEMQSGFDREGVRAVRCLSEEEAEKLCVKGLAAESSLRDLLPEELTADLIEGMQRFDRIIPGFAGPEAYVIGLESRTSSPVRLTRDEGGQSTGLRGLFPCGEGAGYAGGIMSAAVDGIKIAEAVAACVRPIE